MIPFNDVIVLQRDEAIDLLMRFVDYDKQIDSLPEEVSVKRIMSIIKDTKKFLRSVK